MRKFLTIITFFLSTSAFAGDWAFINNNLFWTYYFKIKNIRLIKSYYLGTNIEIKTEIRPAYLSNPLGVRPKQLYDLNQYNFTSTLIYRF